MSRLALHSVLNTIDTVIKQANILWLVLVEGNWQSSIVGVMVFQQTGNCDRTGHNALHLFKTLSLVAATKCKYSFATFLT